MNRKAGQNSRRTFIRTLALMGGAVPLLVGGAKTMGVDMKKKSAALPDPHPSQGYRVTAHIRQYYKKIAV